MIGLDALRFPDAAPEVWCVLTTRTSTLDMRAFYVARKKVVQALRRRWPDVGYACVVEYTTGYGPRSGGERRPHWNMLWKGIRQAEIPRAAEVIRRVWCDHVDALPAHQSVDPVYECGGLAGYLANHVQKESQKPPAGWRGSRFNCSQEYFEGRTRALARLDARASLAWKLLLWKAALSGRLGSAATAWASAERDRQAAVDWVAIRLDADGPHPLAPVTNRDDGPDQEVRFMEDARLVPPNVKRYLLTQQLRVGQVRWCDWCHIVAPAVDAFQREQLDALGFLDGMCSDCAGVIREAPGAAGHA